MLIITPPMQYGSMVSPFLKNVILEMIIIAIPPSLQMEVP